MFLKQNHGDFAKDNVRKGKSDGLEQSQKLDWCYTSMFIKYNNRAILIVFQTIPRSQMFGKIHLDNMWL